MSALITGNSAAARITIAYLTVGILWIVTGDYILEMFVETKHLSPDSVFYINLAKGLAYVFLTAGALFLYSRMFINRITKSELQLETYSKRISKLLDSITDGFVTLDKDWRFTFANKTFQGISGKTNQELMGRNIWELYPTLKDTVFYTYLIKAATERVSLHYEEQYAETQRWYSLGIYPIDDGLAVYYSDITENYQMRDEIYKTRNNLNALINNTVDLIWSVRPDNTIISANDAYKSFVHTFTGVMLSEGDDAGCRILPGLDAGVWDGLYKRALKGEAFTREESYILPDKNALYFEVNFSPIFDDNKAVIGVGCFAREITGRKKHEMQVQEQNNKLMEIARLQSHEVRGPLSTVLGLASLFNKENPADPENIDLLHKIEVAIQKLDDVVQEIVLKSHEVKLANEQMLKEV